jgi:dihydroflavonol-4-reductase
MILITGATGHMGNVLARELLLRGEKVRVFLLPKSYRGSLEGLDVEIFEGDILDYESLDKACKGADVVYHLAAFISVLDSQKDLIRKVNVDGTKNVIRACLKNKVRRLVYTSTVHALREPRKGIPINTDCGFDSKNIRGEYDRTKAEASLAVQEAVKSQGLDAVIVCPTGVVGPYDFQVSSFGQYLVNYFKIRQLMYVGGAYDFVDVRDAVSGIILAGQKGGKGETYLISGQAITIKEINEALGKAFGIPEPKVKVPFWLVMIGAVLAKVYYLITRQKPFLTPYALKTLQRNCEVDYKKSVEELGYSPRDVRTSIVDQVKWYKERGIVK